MTSYELDQWHAELLAEFRSLEETHRELEAHLMPASNLAHLAHLKRLRQYRERLHAYIRARGSRWPVLLAALYP